MPARRLEATGLSGIFMKSCAHRYCYHDYNFIIGIGLEQCREDFGGHHQYVFTADLDYRWLVV